jgi:hypothetical protein
MDIIWDGITRSKTLNKEFVALRHELADSAKNYIWPHVFKLIAKNPELINTTRPDGSSLYAPLHQAAHGGASLAVVQQLLDLGAWRTLRNSRGERPVDVAIRKQHVHLRAILEPVYKHRVPLEVLQKIQQNFHSTIRSRAEELVDQHSLRLPELEPLLELKKPQMWFAVPGMYGGFNYWLVGNGIDARLVSESWCRVVGGSGERHMITACGVVLEETGFV